MARLHFIPRFPAAARQQGFPREPVHSRALNLRARCPPLPACLQGAERAYDDTAPIPASQDEVGQAQAGAGHERLGSGFLLLAALQGLVQSAGVWLLGLCVKKACGCWGHLQGSQHPCLNPPALRAMLESPAQWAVPCLLLSLLMEEPLNPAAAALSTNLQLKQSSTEQRDELLQKADSLLRMRGELS